MPPLHVTAVAFATALVLLVALRPLAVALGFVDRPNCSRKSHVGEVPLHGGLAIFSGLVVAVYGDPALGAHGHALIAVSAFMVMLGMADDRFDLRPRVRLIAHLAAALVLVLGMHYRVQDLGDLLGIGVLWLGPLSLPFTVVACVALVNAFNMLDGLDGLAAGTATMAFVGVIGFSMGAYAPTSVLVACGMAGSLLAFLCFNAPALFNRPLRVFMGDGGSTLLGFVLAAVGILLVQDTRTNVPPVLLLWLMPLPVFELFSTTFRRLRNGQSPAAADAGHYHHRLIRAGLSGRQVFLLYVAVSGLGAAFAVAFLWTGVPDIVAFIAFLGFFAAWHRFVTAAPRFASPVLVP
ncbi:MAG: hypothetical protein RLZZ393_713 [Pseudomonadota bacterium]